MIPLEKYSPYYYLSSLTILILFPLLRKRKEITPWKYREILYLFIFFVFVLCFNFYLGKADKRNPLLYFLWKISFFQFIYFLPLTFIYFIISKRKLKNIYFVVHNKEDILWGLGIGIIIGAIGLLKIFTSKNTAIYGWESYIGRDIISFYSILPMICIIGPLTEELIFRGILIPTFEERVNTGYALLLSSILFVFMHGFFYGAMTIFFFGFILGILFIKRRTIIPGFIVHSMLNFSYFLAIQLVLLKKF